MTFSEAMEHVAQLFEAIGALVLLVGLLFCFTLAIRPSVDRVTVIGLTKCCARPSAA